MGVNMCGLCIVDDDVAREAGKEEIIRRYFQALVDVRMGVANENIIQKMEVIMNKAGLTAEDRKCVIAAGRSKYCPVGIFVIFQCIYIKSGCVPVGHLLIFPFSFQFNFKH